MRTRPLAVLAVFVFAVLSILAAAPAAAQRLSEERGYDYRGGDYSDFRSRSVGSCKQECRDDRRCLGYSYNLRTATCYLKDRVGALQRNSDTVAGLKEGTSLPLPGRPSPGGGLSEEEGYDYKGNDYTDFPARSATACKAECRREARCRAYAYNLRTGTCYLKDRVAPRQRNSETVSGVKGGEKGWPGQGGDFRELAGVDSRGGDYDNFRARGATACREECRRDRRCRAYTFNRESETCYLKDRGGDLQPNRDTVSGIRQER